MAVSAEIKEDVHNNSTKKTFNATLDPSDPIGFLEKVFEFVSKESDLFESEAANAVVRMAKEKAKTEVKKWKEEKTGRKGGEEKKDMNEVAPIAVEKEESVKKLEEKKNVKRVPNKDNGLDMDKYRWGQSLEEVDITVPVPPGTNKRFITSVIKKNHLKVGLEGQPPVLDGELFQPVKVDDCIWTLEDQKSISISLTKQNQMKWWQYLVKGEPEIDTQKVEVGKSNLAGPSVERGSTAATIALGQEVRGTLKRYMAEVNAE